MQGTSIKVLTVFVILLSANLSFSQTINDAVAVSEGSNVFTVVLLPDTQNMVDYKHQKAEGFALNGSEMFLKQMQEISNKSRKNGGKLAFVAAVGDVWQHQTISIDQDHQERGFGQYDWSAFSAIIEVTDKTFSYEIPLVERGYRLFSEADIPFGVIPGNHDYDARWYESRRMIHVGGLDNFLSVFGEDTEFFRDKPWYVAAYAGGTSNAQAFSSGAYTFLNLSLEMQPSDDVLKWAQEVVDLYPGIPTMITTHDYLNSDGVRAPTSVDLAIVDPGYHNSADQVWEKLIMKNDQIFLVVSGHHRGQSFRVDINDAGHEVYQVMVNYQDRGQSSIDAGEPLNARGNPVPTGDGWYRIMGFNLADTVPHIDMTTYSSHYEKYSGEIATYAKSYKKLEQAEMSDSKFFGAEEYSITLTDFYERFRK